jgi:hypothetical protein
MDEKLSEIEFQSRLDDAAVVARIGGRYRHYKGNMYQVVALAIIEATNEPAVIYKALYGKELQFIRPISDWLMTVEWQGSTVPRFTLID